MTPYSQILTFLFLMLGPFKIIVPFVKITANADLNLTRRIALRSIVFASTSLVIAGLLGETILSKYGIPIPILSLAAGLVIFIVALKDIIEQFSELEEHHETGLIPTMKMAVSPLAFPTIVTPYGIAAIIVFLSIFPSNKDRLIIIAMVVGIMLLNLVTMLFAKRIFKPLSIILPILGAILGIVQIALGLNIIFNQLKILFEF